MIPHHQAPIDMVKARLLYGKDPQMHRLGCLARTVSAISGPVLRLDQRTGQKHLAAC